jgi:hypothetical protein
MAVWLLTFSDSDQAFIGSVIIEAPTFLNAIGVAILRNLRPDGEVQGQEIEMLSELPESFHNRLLSLDDLLRLHAIIRL